MEPDKQGLGVGETRTVPSSINMTFFMLGLTEGSSTANDFEQQHAEAMHINLRRTFLFL